MDKSFRGIFDAHPLMPTQFGILSVARLTDQIDKKKVIDKEGKWIRGYSHIYETNPTVRLVQDNGTSAHVINDATGSKRFIDVKAFFLEVEDYASTFDLPGEDRYAKVLRQLEAGTQKSIEHEFYHGYAARANGNNNQFLAKASTANIIHGGALAKMHEGLGYLEYQLAQSPLGEQGVIHMTRDMAAILGSQWIIQRPDEKGVPHLETTNGTPISIGSGYDGSGPKVSISTIAVSSAHVCTITTTLPHTLVVNDEVTVENETGFPDVTAVVTGVPNSTTFTFDVPTVSSFAERAGTGIAYFGADQDHKYMWGTGLIDVILGEPEVMNVEPGHGYDVAGNKNDMRIKALRPVAVHHDPVIHCGIKVQVHE